MALRPVYLALLCLSAVAAATAATADNAQNVSSDDVIYQPPNIFPRGVPPVHGSTARTLSRALADRVSVRDFGAAGDCSCRNGAWEEACCPTDDTAAFMAALASGDDVFVPPGSYRIDGTVEFGGTMVLAGGAALRRVNISGNRDPVVRLTGTHSHLRGGGTISTTNAAPRGIVNIGPHDFTRAHNVEWCTLEGVTIEGPGVSWSYASPNKPVNAYLNGSIGLCLDSTEGLQGNASVGGGATYQNTVSGITIRFVDRGIFLGVQVNGNIITGVQMEAIGQVGYHLEGPNSENVISGGFVAGHGGNTTVIKLTPTWQEASQQFLGCWHNWFNGILNEPGPGSMPYDFDRFSYGNTIIGHENCYGGGVQWDKSWTFLEAGKLQLGDFNNSAAHARAGPGGPWKPQGDRPTLQVEGLGYIKKLEHGFPAVRSGLVEPAVQAVDDEPVLLRDPAARAIVVSKLAVLGDERDTTPKACYYEVTVSGFGLALGDAAGTSEVRVFAGRYLVTPWALGVRRGLVAQSLTNGAGANDGRAQATASVGGLLVEMKAVVRGQDTLVLSLGGGDAVLKVGEREVVVDVRRVGHGCVRPAVHEEF